MKTIINNKKLNIIHKYPFPFDTNNSLFFDVETTGFSPSNSFVYLIGAMYIEKDCINTIQFFAEEKDEEVVLFHEFFKLLNKFENLVHFNGEGFDMPFVTERCKKYNLNYDFNDVQSFDIYKDTLMLKKLIKTENFKQKTLETFLGLNRKDMYDGGKLIKVYKEYLKKKNENSLKLLLLHNVEDIMGMYELLNLYAYKGIFEGYFSLNNYTFNNYKDFEGNEKIELLLTLDLKYKLKTEISSSYTDFYMYASGNTLKLKIPVTDGLVKYYYEDYKNYYYLPKEDKAIHKSVAAFVDKEYRTKATALNCYNKINPELFINDEEKLKTYVTNILKIFFK